MLNGKYCGNCQYWTNARPTSFGVLPYFGDCVIGRPFKAGKYFRRNTKDGIKTFKYCAFTVRTDRCKDWKEKTEDE